jgi:hypothetical protein
MFSMSYVVQNFLIDSILMKSNMETITTSEHSNVNEALEHLKSVLVKGESLDAWAIQPRIFALTHRRRLIAATSGRFIYIQRNLFGGFKMNDFRWQDLQDTKLDVGIFGADITFRASDNSDLNISKSQVRNLEFRGFDKVQTQEIYRLAQAQDQSWREKRRLRELEEMRAKSGGLNVGGYSASVSQAGQTSDDSFTRLQKAKEMLDNKLITDSEYETIKARIISGL